MMKITESNNFCRVFELPLDYPEEFCFGGGRPVMFKMVDWFNPIPSEDIHSEQIKSWKDYIPRIKEFVCQKRYLEFGRSYLLITNFNESFIFSKKETGRRG